jgi:hypothetical protein
LTISAPISTEVLPSPPDAAELPVSGYMTPIFTDGAARAPDVAMMAGAASKTVRRRSMA